MRRGDGKERDGERQREMRRGVKGRGGGGRLREEEMSGGGGG